MKSLDLKRSASIKKATPLASRVLEDYAYWLTRHYGKTGTYLVNAKTFLKTCNERGSVISQLDSYAEEKSFTLRSFLKRFRGFLETKNIDFVINDLKEKKLPISNIYVKLFLAHVQDRLRGESSTSTYATVLNQFFNTVDNNLYLINKRSAEKFILSPALSDYTKRLYKSILRAFCQWVLIYQEIPARQLNHQQKIMKAGLLRISAQSLREISAIQVRSARSQLKSYHKESLTSNQRSKLLKICKSQHDRAIIALMAWNGLRTIEITRLSVNDCLFRELRISVWSKGKTARTKDLIKFFAVPAKEVRLYLKQTDLKKGKVFPGISKVDIDQMIRSYFQHLKLFKKNLKYSPHSLRHTAGQLMYDKGIRLEFIQKTLRHSMMETTLVYAQKAIDRNYFRKMPSNF